MVQICTCKIFSVWTKLATLILDKNMQAEANEPNDRECRQTHRDASTRQPNSSWWWLINKWAYYVVNCLSTNHRLLKVTLSQITVIGKKNQTDVVLVFSPNTYMKLGCRDPRYKHEYLDSCVIWVTLRGWWWWWKWQTYISTRS